MLHAGHVNAQTQANLDALPLAKSFCSSPDFQKLTCGLATDAEQDATLGDICLRCGSIARFAPRVLPAELRGDPIYFQRSIEPISLACKGPVVVRIVFKLLPDFKAPTPSTAGPTGELSKQLYQNCTDFALESHPQLPNEAVRCELELPETGGTEAEKAVKAREGRCWACGSCQQGKGCPNKVGKWYSDAYTTVARGCEFDVKVGFVPQTVYYFINPKTTVLLAKFEVCNNPGCFDPAYEEAKKVSARSCDKGRCV